MQRVVAWSINLVWSDDTEEVVVDVPQYVATQVDNWLTELEEERMVDTEESEDE
jgi:hypothetical protein